MTTFSFSITTDANTKKSDNNFTTLSLTKGIITRMYVDFAWGQARYCHVVFLHGQYQVIPINTDGNLAGDERLFLLEPMYLLEMAPFSLVAHTWNDSYRNAHTIDIIIEVQDARLVFPQLIYEEMLNDLRQQQETLYKLYAGELVP